jgi:beta-xylosidase
MSTFVTKNVIDNITNIDGIGYWKVSAAEDLIRNIIEFPGKIGLYSKYNIQKPQLMAHIFLQNLLSIIVDYGKGYIITKSTDNKRLVILLYNYEHYSERYGNGELKEQVKLNRYTAFVKQNELDFSIELKDIYNYKFAVISKFLTNRKYGSVYDSWVEMGKPSLASQDKVRVSLLKGLAQPLFKVYTSKIENNTLLIHEHLAPFEVKTLSINIYESEDIKY